MTSAPPFDFLILVAETQVDGRQFTVRLGVHPEDWKRHPPDFRRAQMEELRRRLAWQVEQPIGKLKIRTFLWDGEHEIPLTEDQLQAPADQGR
ncbi:hypothetical protein EF903_06900 [Streptomyces sp. WAC05292]|uniref:hypothetical protein n=1 Tax=Streptomyces sp. WAC05292 TaxID=2487418 RepID=UPI000F743A0F|nr:hypothetical protein [Streptomyces sp. WAC05292]RSS94260.1 hypothetical protein EF903_06900 [Streptomyces sp. WAC05292]